MRDCLAFIASYQSPPEYRCAAAETACLPLGPSEHVCGPFSMVRAMRRLSLVLEGAGLPEIAALCATAGSGYVESRINKELDLVPYRDDPERWFRINAAKTAARNIRKWGIEP